MAGLFGDRRLSFAAAALGLAFALLNALAQWTVFAALGVAPNFFVVMAVVALGTAAGIALGTPGGAGASEAAMIAAFAALGVDRVDATAATLLYRALHYASVLAVGAPALIYLEGRRGGARATVAPPVPPPAPVES